MFILNLLIISCTYYLRYPRKSIINIPHSIALQLRRICDSDEKLKHRSKEYTNYLIARDYHPGLVDKQFQKVEMTSRHNARKKIKKHIHYLHLDEVLEKVFPNNKVSVIYKRNKNLKQMVASSLYPKPSIKINRTIASCSKCDICNSFLITDSNFICAVTVKTYFLKCNLSCDSCNVIYLITCSNR